MLGFILGLGIGFFAGWYITKRRLTGGGSLSEQLKKAMNEDPYRQSNTKSPYYSVFDPFTTLDDEQQYNYPGYTKSTLTKIW